MQKKKGNRRTRYYLHWRIRKQGYTLITRSRTVYVAHNQPVVMTHQLSRLIKEFGYAIQTEIT